MDWPEGFIGVDWGTTNRRAYRIDGSGNAVGEFEDGRGILSLERTDFPAAVAEIRSRLGDLPMLMAGMIGSNRGWIEAPYTPCPAGLEELAGRLVWAEAGRTAIVPGVSLRTADQADVMRGEEVQLLGAVAEGAIPADCVVCHPGTHNKWVTVRSGRIAEFRTVMTGELFNLLKDKSILSDLLAEPTTSGDAFRNGVQRGLAGRALTAELFSVRARVLLGVAERNDAASFTSGLLIGTDVRSGLETPAVGDEVIVMGRPELTALYANALDVAGRRCRQFDGERAFIAGIKSIAERIAA